MASGKISWVQWTSRRSGVTKAFAVDKENLDSKGVARAVNGAAIPADAEPAKRGTEKDAFCVRILEKRKERAAAKAEKPGRAPRKDEGTSRKAKAAAA